MDQPQHIETLFFQALDRAPEERADFLDQACQGNAQLRREVEALLAADADPPAILKASTEDLTQLFIQTPGRQVGPYQILEVIGQGGMGIVYRAIRSDVGKVVALKLTHTGHTASLHTERFLQERRILAHLQHPNIAQLLDAGTTPEGAPFFAMEYVEGRPLTAYCDQQQDDITTRLQLFHTVCVAVEQAHRHQIVHRDLKPSNILVQNDGTVKLLDFGIAKWLDVAPEAPLTRTGVHALTPAYASPEQVRGEPVSPASDVYSLGILLYELLTGQRPYEVQGKTPSEIERVICDIEPARPSTVITRTIKDTEADSLSPLGLPAPASVSSSITRAASPEALKRRLKGDLDTIVMMALRKEPHRRYASAGALGDDIRRHLEHHPVLARKDTLGYRTRKFIRRNRWPVTALVVLMLLGAGSLFYRQTQQQARQKAQRETTQAQEVSAWLNDLAELVTDVQSLEDPAEKTRQMLLFTQSSWQQSEGQPYFQARIAVGAGRYFREAGQYLIADSLLQNALSLLNTHAAISVAHRVVVLEEWGYLNWDRNNLAEADQVFRDVLDLKRRIYPDSPELVYSLRSQAKFYLAFLIDEPRAEELVRESVTVAQAIWGSDHLSYAESLVHLGAILRGREKYEEAESLLRNALALQRRLAGDEDLWIATSHRHLGLLFMEQGRLDSAEVYLQDALARFRQFGVETQWEVVKIHRSLADLYEQASQDAKYEHHLRQILAIQAKRHGANPTITEEAESRLAELLNP